jgi:uncharacterized SAM-binding protein YcdF (DUF218 family)
MFFVMSKLFWIVFMPSHFLALTTIAAAILLATRYERVGRRLAFASAVLFVIIGILPTGTWLTLPLENRYTRPDWPAHIDGVLVLGGGTGTAVILSRGVPATKSSEPRLVAAYELARRYPNARIVFSGGSSQLGGGGAETVGAKYIFAQVGLDPKRLILEGRSRNTGEDVAFSQKIAKPKPGEVWILATSAIHMPRAMHIAKRAHWKMIAWPTDYSTTPKEFGSLFAVPGNLDATDKAIHEWIGLLVYR